MAPLIALLPSLDSIAREIGVRLVQISRDVVGISDLIELAGISRDSVNRDIAALLRSSPSRDEARQWLGRAFLHSLPQFRLAAIRISQLRSELGSVPRLIAALADPVMEVRHAAVAGLCLAGGADAVLALRAVLQWDSSAEVREAAARALGDVDAPERASAAKAWRFLRPALQLTNSPLSKPPRIRGDPTMRGCRASRDSGSRCRRES